MNSDHSQISRDGQTIDVVTNNESGLRIMVTRNGAELISLARRDPSGNWRGFLYRDGDISRAPSGWNNHATVMGYYIHRIVGEASTYRGQPVRGSTHSFLRHKIFAAPQQDQDGAAVTYQLSPEQIQPEEYPLRVAFALTYALAGDTLRTTFRFENLEKKLSAHVGFGLHPGFGATSLESCEVLLPAGQYVRHFAPGNFLSGATESFDHPGGPMPFRKEELPGSFLLELKEVPVPIFFFADRDSRRQIHLNFSGVPYVTLWSDGHPFICIEPCWGLPDHQEQRPFESKLGMQEIAPGGVLERSFTMAPSFQRRSADETEELPKSSSQGKNGE